MITTKDGTVEDARICLNAVHVVPYRAVQAEKVIVGTNSNEAIAEEASRTAVAQAKPLEHNKYKVAVARALVKRAILACGEDV
jgi:xanthine dehydrogenase YagS FAD-binding subunit